MEAPRISPARLAAGFAAGLLATLIFHQLVLAVLWSAGVAPSGPFQMAPTKPFGVPTVFSLSFWGGVWGIIYALCERRFPAGKGYWVTAFFFGGVLLSLVALLVVLPLKGRPPGGGWNPYPLVTALLVNGAWGIGTGAILKTSLREEENGGGNNS